MTRLSRWLLFVTLLTAPLWTACQTAEEPAGGQESVSAAELSPAELGEIGAELDQSPDRAEEILREKGIDPDEFGAAVREIAADVDAARKYSRAFAEAQSEAGGDSAG